MLIGPTTAATNSNVSERHAPLSFVPIPICGDRISLVRVIRSDGEMGNVDDEYADSMLTSPGRLMAAGAAGALNAVTAEGVVTTRAVNRLVAVRMVFMVVLSLG